MATQVLGENIAKSPHDLPLGKEQQLEGAAQKPKFTKSGRAIVWEREMKCTPQ